jgi:hypothetical protein
MRRTLALTSGLSSRRMTGRHMFIGKCRRSGAKPACISAAIARASARGAGSAGHSRARGYFSARYSSIASDSQTCTSPSTSAGTFAAPETLLTRALKSVALSEITSSSKAMPATFMAIHGRSDHEE